MNPISETSTSAEVRIKKIRDRLSKVEKVKLIYWALIGGDSKLCILSPSLREVESNLAMLRVATPRSLYRLNLQRFWHSPGRLLHRLARPLFLSSYLLSSPDQFDENKKCISQRPHGSSSGMAKVPKHSGREADPSGGILSFLVLCY